MADYKMRVGADNLDRTEYSANAESYSTFVITISNDSKEKLIDGEEFTQAIELNDNEFNLWVKQKTDLKGWRVSIVVNSGTTILVGKIIGVVIEPLESGAERTTANCLMSNGSYLSLVIDNTDGTLEGTLSSVGKIGSGVEIPEPTALDIGKFLGVNNNSEYELQDVKTYNKITKELTTSSGSATFSATSDEWVSGMNNDNTLLEIHDLATSTYYTLWLTDFNATTLTFTGITNTNKLVATITKNGSDYDGAFSISALPTGTQVVELSSYSGTLTDEQFAKISGDDCVILHDGYFYYKGLDSNGSLKYYRIPFMNFASNLYEVAITINKTTKGFVYSETKKIQYVQANPTLTGNEPELLGLDIGGTIYKAQSLSQTDGIKCAYATPADFTIADSYSSYNRCGNILTFVLAFSITKNNATTSSTNVATFSSIPASIFTKLVPTTVGANDYLDQVVLNAFDDTYTNVAVPVALSKGVNSDITLAIDPTNLIVSTTYHLRYFVSFLMTDNLTKIDPVLANNSWADIKAVCEAGEAGDYWNVGDTKSDLGTDGNTRTFRIAHIS